MWSESQLMRLVQLVADKLAPMFAVAVDPAPALPQSIAAPAPVAEQPSTGRAPAAMPDGSSAIHTTSQLTPTATLAAGNVAAGDHTMSYADVLGAQQPRPSSVTNRDVAKGNQASPPPQLLRRVNAATNRRNPYGMDDVWFNMHTDAWPTLAESSMIAKQPRRARHNAAAKTLAAALTAMSVGGANAESINAGASLDMTASYGQDFAAFALGIFCLVALFVVIRFLVWCTKGRHTARLVNVIAVVLFVPFSVAHMTKQFCSPALWYALRMSGWAEFTVIGLFLIVTVSSVIWAALANKHYKAVQYE
jgi:hypothetical protein